jgi:hypothetical protein
MNTELDKIKLKIKALAAKTVDNGCSEHEAMSAMLGVGRLLSQYNLTMEECDVRQSPCKTIYIDIGRTHRHPIDHCVVALANLVSVKCWFHRHYGKPSSYAFFGQESDLELVDYLFKVIHRAIETESELFKQDERYYVIGEAGLRRSATVSFQRGMACRISQRLSELKKQNDAELARHRPTGTSLVVLKKQLIEEEFKKSGVKLGTTRATYRINNRSAFDHGHAAGNKVNLSRPITGQGKTGGLLT